MAESLVLGMNEESGTRFMAVRFGNVLGSNGSLVQILQRQIKRGGPVTVTHPRITRYFMTIPEAVGLVIVASVQNEGDLCVLDMGPPLNVDRLAREMISLSGLVPDKDIEVVYTGLRPGEKMYEELFTEEEKRRPSTHPRIFLAEAAPCRGERDGILTAARRVVAEGDEAVLAFLRTHVPDYRPAADDGRPPPGTGRMDAIGSADADVS
jgi:FlaA1/EpsC-like NDP-sugar epimerase